MVTLTVFTNPELLRKLSEVKQQEQTRKLKAVGGGFRQLNHTT